MDKQLTDRISQFFAPYPNRLYTKGQSLIWHDENPPGVIYLLAGTVGQYDINKNGQKIMLNIFKPSAFFPLSWAINHTPNVYFFEALSDVECKIAPAERVVDFLQLNSDVTFDLLGRVFKGTDGLLKRLNEAMTGTARSQLMLELAISTYRFGILNADGSHTIKIKTTELATRTGMSRETISRELKKLAEQDIITNNRGHITVHNVDMLYEKLKMP